MTSLRGSVEEMGTFLFILVKIEAASVLAAVTF